MNRSIILCCKWSPLTVTMALATPLYQYGSPVLYGSTSTYGMYVNWLDTSKGSVVGDVAQLGQG